MKTPYKFLDYYGKDDVGIFFGRERETEILLSDIVVARLVVLFAKTGTGKTSLINAGVRPRLEELDYVTFYVRVEKDPAQSVKKILREGNLLPAGLEERSFADQLVGTAQALQKPIVVFFDQFEEFFIHVFATDREKARQFIAEIARLYRNRDSQVHLVFSMREEFFVEMDGFRDEIPSIFHNDSNLRLRWLDKDQARRAIVMPAKQRKTDVEEDLVTCLINDLAQNEGIEPARLQIVCDTLWSQKSDGRIRLEDYRRLGGTKQILDRRLEEDLDTSLNEGQLRLFEKLVPKLSTEPGTKYVCGFDELVETLTTDAETLAELVRVLKKLGWLRESTVYQKPYIEWTSDYLAERTDYLQNRARAISLRRLLRRAVDQAKSKGAELAPQKSPTDAPWIEPSSVETRDALYMNPADLAAVSEGEGLLREIGPTEAEFLFVAALEHGAHMSLWYRRARDGKVDVGHILRDRIEYGEAQSPQVKNTLLLLGELRDTQAMELLRLALKQPDLGLIVLEVLGEVRTSEAVELLRDSVQQEALAVRAVDVLRRMCTQEAIVLLGEVLTQKGTVALHAGMALKRIAGGRPSEASSQAHRVLTEVLAKQAEPLFLQALAQGLDMHLWFEEASRNGVDVWRILEQKITDDSVPIRQAENAIRLLSVSGSAPATKFLAMALRQPRLSHLAEAILAEVETKETVEIWGALAQQEDLASLSQEKLQSIAKNRTATADVRNAARHMSQKSGQAQGEFVVEPEIASRTGRAAGPAVREGLGGKVWETLLSRIAAGKCTPLLGPGVNPREIGLRSEIAQAMAKESGYSLADSSDLAHVSQFLAIVHDGMYPKERVLSLMRDQIERADIRDLVSAPDTPLGVLASLPFPLYITINYDDLIARALRARGKNPTRELLRWNKDIARAPSLFDSGSGFESTLDRPVVYHLYGHDEVPESLVLTEDDYVSFLVNISRQHGLLPPWIRQALAETSLLLIGFPLATWDYYILFEGLLGSTRSGLRRDSLAVGLPPADDEQQRAYLSRFLERFYMHVYWGTPGEFAAELHRRWERFSR